MKNPLTHSWDRTRDLPICSTALCYRGPHTVRKAAPKEDRRLCINETYILRKA